MIINQQGRQEDSHLPSLLTELQLLSEPGKLVGRVGEVEHHEEVHPNLMIGIIMIMIMLMVVMTMVRKIMLVMMMVRTIMLVPPLSSPPPTWWWW